LPPIVTVVLVDGSPVVTDPLATLLEPPTVAVAPTPPATPPTYALAVVPPLLLPPMPTPTLTPPTPTLTPPAIAGARQDPIINAPVMAARTCRCCLI
jgi:hypothetical protein